MLPSILAKQLEEGLGDYIETTFPMTNAPFRGSVQRMVEETRESVYREPYVAVRLPFRVSESMPSCFEAIHMDFKPYVHQARAFDRLVGDDARSTLIATGTGSGKTECFLYPILEYCYQHRGQPGIKAVIIYPMNALATDQARRIGELIWNSPELKGNVTAGMYVGGQEGAPSRGMSEHGVITDHETMINSAPDILMTNYKMLDYLLVRPKDAKLWQDNKPETLKYIAVDELHTFDGAQGTDLACLLRRLKARMGTPSGYLCCIGTSATMGDKDNAKKIREYAGNIFGEPFESDAVVTEDRMSADEFFEGQEVTDFGFPTKEHVQRLENDISADHANEFLRDAAAAWLDTEDSANDILSDEGRLALHERLLHHSFFQALITVMGGRYYQVSGIVKELDTRYPALKDLGSLSDTAINALFALTSHARIGSAGHLRPFLNVQVQLWVRELRRMVANVDPVHIRYSIAHDLNKEQSRHYLPVVNCRDCGATGWVSYANEQQNVEMQNLTAFYNKFFAADDHVVMMFPYEEVQENPASVAKAFVCPECLKVHFNSNNSREAVCDSCGTEMVPVLIPTPNQTSGSRDHKQYVCPFCGSRRGISLMGVRSATEISATISQLFTSKFNDDKKTLAFSDNVQDAAHKAGFFNARTWRFGLRTTIQKYIQSGGAHQSLSVFTAGFLAYWSDEKRLSREDFVSMFIPPNMTWMSAYEDMLENRKLGTDRLADKLVNGIRNRLSYEIMMEYGLGARVGRTLEKSGCSALYFDPDDIEDVAARVQERTVNELGVLNKTDSRAFQRMVLGFLNTMRLNGAFHDSAFYEYINNNFNSYLLSADRLHWMPGVQSGRNTPRFIAIYRGSGRGKISAYDSYTDRKYTDCIARNADVVPNDNLYEDVTRIILEESVRNGIVKTLPSNSDYLVYGLSKDKVYITDQVKQERCGICGSVYAVPVENLELWEDAPCQRRICKGSLHEDVDAGLDYYGKLFSSGDIARVNAREHTGLLDREDREKLEIDFKRTGADRELWDPNVLSCTPTLEMGIDIGDLSTVILCDMPPAQAQFLQRSGRAGRKDGNALTLIVANAKPHDLYFYAEPMEMIAGNVEPPKIFLNASAVLERQYAAYCMDSWVKRGVSEEAVPKKMESCLSKLDRKPADVFPFNFLNYVQNNTTNRLNSFVQLFPELEMSTRDELTEYARGKGTDKRSLATTMLDAFTSLRDQQNSVRKNIRDLDNMIKVLKGKPKDTSYDEEIKELNSEKKALEEVIRSMGNKNVFNFLSDEGILPNYAFPEAGIILKAIMYRREDSEEENSRESKKNVQKMVYEYHRSASAAISEFAPNNTFYADGHKMQIDQIDVSTAQPARWRLCPNCSYAQMEETGKNTAECPRCHCVAWADSGQVRNMLKVQMVYSNMDVSKRLISDDSDNRTVKFYNKQILVDVDEDKDVLTAYHMDNDEFPFGYEYVRKAVLREINFGEDDMVGEKLMVSGVEGVAKGFRVCKYCGKIIPDDAKGYNSKYHTKYCKSLKLSPIEQENAVDECLFLYREFQTEALRILVPATTMDPVATESFVAAFMLGLKEKFGNIDHLRATISEVPVPETDKRKQYMVIYDSVPGGTGYLKQFIRHDTDDPDGNLMVQILEKALAVMEKCSCKDEPQKDGCYHCLYAYRQSSNIGNISRKTAMKLLSTILSGKNTLEKIDKIGSIDPNKLFDSELERRFVAAFEEASSGQHRITTTNSIVNGKEGYILKINDITWEIEPQVLLDSEQGVSVKCKPDFVIWPVTQRQKKPVAVFTDGFTYHKDIAADDTLKREAIRRSGNFIVWSLSYKDVQDVFVEGGDYYTNPLMAEKMPSGAKVYQPMITVAHADGIRPDKMSSFELLLRYLELGKAEEQFRTHARAYSLSLVNAALVSSKLDYMDWKSVFDSVAGQTHFTDEEYPAGGTIFGRWAPRTNLPLMQVYAGINIGSLQADRNKAAEVCAVLDDRKEHRTDHYEEEWNGFLKFSNIMQFLPGFMAVSRKGMDDNTYLSLPVSEIVADASLMNRSSDEAVMAEEQSKVTDGWQAMLDEELSYSPEDVIAFAKKIREMGIPVPDSIGYDVTDETGAVVASVEVAWTQKKIGYITEEQETDRGTLEQMGWMILDCNSEITSALWKRGE